MREPRTHRPIDRSRKKRAVPLSILRTSEAVKTVVNHPRRLEELMRMLEDKDRAVRGRAATALARLSESHPARLLRIVERLREGLRDDSAYVRWHLIYTLGELGSRFPSQLQGFLNDIANRLEDDDRVVRVLACWTLSRVAVTRPGIIGELFKGLKREPPPAVAKALERAGSKSRGA